MYRLEKTWREDTFLNNEAKNPSFSSTLLDKIYRSIDEGERKSSSDMKFYRETTCKKPSKSRTSGKCDGMVEEQDAVRRARLLEKWVDKKVIAEKVGIQWNTQTDKKLHHYQDRDNDALFFSSTSNSSDSSSGGLSSSDTESMYGVRSRASCFAPSRPKPVRTTIPEKPDKTRRHSIVGGGAMQMFDDYTTHHNSSIASNEEGLIKSKSRALKIYNNLKKVKQPISPGGKLTNFLNSLLSTKRSSNKSSTPSSVIGGYEEGNAERKAKSGQASSTCSSASSFSRSCLSKTTPSSREKMRNDNGVKRTVRFYPVSVIVGEDSRPCGHKCLYEEDTNLMSMSVPTAWKIGRSPPSSKKIQEQELKFPVMENNREFLKEYHRNHNKSNLVLKDVDEEDDDAASYSSSDLFELDHLAMIGDNRYCEELPVYETTHFGTNRAIANGLRV